MIHLLTYVYHPTWSYGPTAVFLLTIIIASIYILSSRIYRTALGYSILAASTFGFIHNLFITLPYNFGNYSGTGGLDIVGMTRAFWFFYGSYLAFAFMPGFIAFRGMSKQRSSKFGACIVYFAYFWAFVVAAAGLSLTIITIINNPLKDYANLIGGDIDESERAAVANRVTVYNTIALFVYYSSWVFVALILVLHVVNFTKLHGKARTTLIAFTTLNVISVAIFVVSMNLLNREVTESWIFTTFCTHFVLVDIPVAVALIIAIHYGPIWKLKSLEDRVGVESHNYNYDIENTSIGQYQTQLK